MATAKFNDYNRWSTSLKLLLARLDDLNGVYGNKLMLTVATNHESPNVHLFGDKDLVRGALLSDLLTKIELSDDHSVIQLPLTGDLSQTEATEHTKPSMNRRRGIVDILELDSFPSKFVFAKGSRPVWWPDNIDFGSFHKGRKATTRGEVSAEMERVLTAYSDYSWKRAEAIRNEHWDIAYPMSRRFRKKTIEYDTGKAALSTIVESREEALVSNGGDGVVEDSIGDEPVHVAHDAASEEGLVVDGEDDPLREQMNLQVDGSETGGVEGGEGGKGGVSEVMSVRGSGRAAALGGTQGRRDWEEDLVEMTDDYGLNESRATTRGRDAGGRGGRGGRGGGRGGYSEESRGAYRVRAGRVVEGLEVASEWNRMHVMGGDMMNGMGDGEGEGRQEWQGMMETTYGMNTRGATRGGRGGRGGMADRGVSRVSAQQARGSGRVYGKGGTVERKSWLKKLDEVMGAKGVLEQEEDDESMEMEGLGKRNDRKRKASDGVDLMEMDKWGRVKGGGRGGHVGSMGRGGIKRPMANDQEKREQREEWNGPPKKITLHLSMTGLHTGFISVPAIDTVSLTTILMNLPSYPFPVGYKAVARHSVSDKVIPLSTHIGNWAVGEIEALTIEYLKRPEEVNT